MRVKARPQERGNDNESEILPHCPTVIAGDTVAGTALLPSHHGSLESQVNRLVSAPPRFHCNLRGPPAILIELKIWFFLVNLTGDDSSMRGHGADQVTLGLRHHHHDERDAWQRARILYVDVRGF